MRLVFTSWCIGLALAAFACDDGNTNGVAVGGCTAAQQLCNGVCVAAGTCQTTPGTGGATVTTTATGNGGAANGGQTSVATGGTQTTATATGGKANTGGSPATGGAKPVDNPTVCDDTATINAELAAQYSKLNVSTTNNPNKSYVVITNWWGKFANQTVAINGLGFTVTNSATTDNPSNPVGYPSMFIGTYQDNASTGSNLPKLVSSISQAPTIFETNATSLDNSNFNAAYDVWFTATSETLATKTVNGAQVRPSSPGSGGAYLMVWLYKPSAKVPRGSSKATVTIENKSWDVWSDTTDPPCITYVAKTAISGMSFDLNNFIKDAVSRNVVKNSMYLSIIFGGFEIWSGGNGATLNKFCAKVN